ncbi:DNA helicase/exodeoxyribonuclease V, subunit A [Gemmobacter megaterium]|uniref:DNA 3'-5' helicase n=1 Tax=Gemmobacter megaterium TaxID=1086013 RepID=A0A1N7MIG0_9RHOB|nr:double-strand break repair helicase AddA [Gemmobacter megaterium]GGE06621.1 double-strand break repair helicase AddA [Gemmobacter megaterium]SIS85862.1 DNA helicase/exodeoxyribonuclease V, subunit A [Gemmobacter megaterium]
MTLSASAVQQMAADPSHSVWTSANAGSGKTKVLTDRVARLLLSGTEPQRILCLTYTKAAAAEMQNRLFRRLGEWAMMPEPALRDALAGLGLTAAPDADTLAAARRLFARAIETPGGLKIQTIHSFCASLLRRFPLEAQVSPGFSEMDDRSADLLRAEIVEDMAERLAPQIIARLARHYTGEDFLRLAAEVARNRARFAGQTRATLATALGLAADDTPQRLLADVFLGGEAEWLTQVAALLAAGSTTDSKAAQRIKALDLLRAGLRDLAGLESVLLTGSSAKEPFSAKIGAFPTKATRGKLGDLITPLENLMARVESARPRRLALESLERSCVLHDFAATFLPEYDRRKQARGWLDFDDLILRARDLLSVSSVAQWVLYRLDGGIDHILVDEAQDTGPDQWRVIELLAQEFTAGQGARDQGRTIFVVGDKKQSIYSFQGADLEKFDAMQTHFTERLAAMGTALHLHPLEYSFRSSPAVLGAVDATCAPFDSLGQVSHIAFRAAMPGRVDLWPAVEAEDDPDPGDWFDPVDLPSPRAPEVVLAERIASQIKALLAAGTRIPISGGGSRAMQAGDVLILVQRRSALFHEVIRACKAAELPIAGADRLKLGAEIAVKDLAALLAFLATPEDDLSLATALRSPLFGWDEQQIYDLAQGRGRQWLWETLRKRDDHAVTLTVLHDLRNRADFLRPFELIDRILTRHDGRRRLIARLGAEAEDGIDQFLSQALAYERMEVPSLTGFLTWLSTDDVEVKRQADSAGNRIRVMTVHGSKGLEAPVVILPDTGDRRPAQGGEVLVLEDGTPVWKTAAEQAPPRMAEALENGQRRWREENQRLLYVAMTRAESWLIVAAAGKTEKPESWHSCIRAGLQRLNAVPLETPSGTGLRHAFSDWPVDGPPEQAVQPSLPALPRWAATPAAPVTKAPAPLKPSDLGGPKALPGESPLTEAEAKARGTLLHRLLEVLPDHAATDWPALAEAMEADPALLAEAQGVLTAPDLAFLFAPGTLAEVEFASLLNGRPMPGLIDRLVVMPDHVLAVDFKSNATVPDSPAEVPEGLLRQMGAYAHALAAIYPDRRIDTALLWTSCGRLMHLPHDLVSQALTRAGLP